MFSTFFATYLSIVPTFSTFLNYIHFHPLCVLFSSIVCAIFHPLCVLRDWWKSEEYGKMFGRGEEEHPKHFRFYSQSTLRRSMELPSRVLGVYDKHNKFNYLKLYFQSKLHKNKMKIYFYFIILCLVFWACCQLMKILNF